MEARGQHSTEKLSFGALWDGVLSLVAAAFFLLSAQICFSDVFSDYRIGIGFAVTRIVLAVPVVVFFEWICRFRPKLRRWGHLAVPAVYLAGHVVFFLSQHERILSGSVCFGRDYVQLVNYYYKVNIIFDQSAGTGSGGYAAEFWFSVVFFFLLFMSYFSEKRAILGLFPLVVLVLEMFVGLTPGFWGVAFGFAGILLAGCGGWGSQEGAECRQAAGRRGPEAAALFSVILAIGMAVSIPLCSRLAFAGRAAQLAADADLFKNFQNMLETRLESLSFFQSEETQGAVNNRTPHYQDKEVLQLTIKIVGVQEDPDDFEGKPAITGVGGLALGSGQYLRGFYGVDYVDGVWVGDSGSFSEACGKSGYDTDEVTRFVSQQSSTKLEQMGTVFDTMGLLEDAVYEKRSYNLKYTGLKSSRGYLPYLLGGNSEELLSQMEGDVLFGRPERNKELACSGWNAYLTDSALLSALSRQESELDVFYNHYVQNHYLGTCPEDVPAVRDAASRIRELISRQDLEEGMAFERNYARLAYANAVSNYLSKGEYSLELDRISDGTDALQYFLEKSKKGYCVHYASAGVLILRTLGVPARYASGYIAEAGSFVKGAGEGSYTAGILDSDAHAWAEIYLDNIGWIPIEMTPPYRSGGSGMMAGNDPVMDVPDDGSGDDDALDQQESQEPDGTEEQDESEVGQNRENPQDTEDDALAGESGQGSKGEKNGQGNSGGKRTDGIILTGAVLCLAGAVLAWAAVFVSVRRKRITKLLELELQQQKNRRAVRRMNRRIYRKLCRRQHLFGKMLSDREYEKNLVLAFPDIGAADWKTFMELVEKVQFSLNEITKEEAQFCHNIYEKTVIGRN